jgi:hypothetical protein
VCVKDEGERKTLCKPPKEYRRAKKASNRKKCITKLVKKSVRSIDYYSISAGALCGLLCVFVSGKLVENHFPLELWRNLNVFEA